MIRWNRDGNKGIYYKNITKCGKYFTAILSYEYNKHFQLNVWFIGGSEVRKVLWCILPPRKAKTVAAKILEDSDYK